jgi:hypothetical protein
MPGVQSVHNRSRTETEIQSTMASKPLAEMSRMNNQQKAEFVGDIFHTRSFWGSHGKISPKTCFIQEGMICQKY